MVLRFKKMEDADAIYGSYADLAALKAVDTTPILNHSKAYVTTDGEFVFRKKSSLADDASTIIAPTTGGGRWIKIASASDNNLIKLVLEGGSGSGSGSVVTVTNVTYSELAAHISAGTLVPGGLYKITNYQTKHIVPNSAHLNVNGVVYVDKTTAPTDLSEGVEELIVMAIATNKISGEAFSHAFPQDIIRYDFSKNLCEDGVTTRPGYITYRKDSDKNIETYYDWRTVKFIRYKLNPLEYVSTTTYSKGSFVLSGGIIYKCLINSTVGIAPSTAGSNVNWTLVVPNQNGLYFAPASSGQDLAGHICPVDASNFKHFNTFSLITNATTMETTPYINSEVYNISIGRGENGNLSNIVFVVPASSAIRHVKIAERCADTTFSKQTTDLTTGTRFSGNLILSSASNLTIGNNCFNNILTAESGFSLASSNLGNTCYNNICHGLNQSTWGAGVHSNVWKLQCRFSFVGHNVIGNYFGSVFSQNQISSTMSNSTFRGSVTLCAFNAELSSTTFNNNLERMVINVRVASKTITANTDKLNVVVNYASASGRLYYSSIIETIDNGNVTGTTVTATELL
jgi:hypothetical protein